MMCRICGTEKKVKFYPSKRQALCQYCAEDTPPKVGRESFEAKYWGAEVSNVPDAIRREFYSDYLASSCNVEQYMADTISWAALERRVAWVICS